MMKHQDNRPVSWRVLPGQTPYGPAIERMERTRDRIIAGTEREQVWLLTSPAGYSRGATAWAGPAPDASVREVQHAARSHAGGYWYHGPGELGVILLLDLRQRRPSAPGIVSIVHEWIVAAMTKLGVDAHVRSAMPGVWTTVAGEERKLAAVALSLKQWVTAYGAGINVDPDMKAFDKIAPCGSDPCAVTSLRQLGSNATVVDVGAALRETFHERFGFTSVAVRHHED